jgi:hypothetical protein
MPGAGFFLLAASCGNTPPDCLSCDAHHASPVNILNPNIAPAVFGVSHKHMLERRNMSISVLPLRIQSVIAPNPVPALACPGTPGLAMYRDVRWSLSHIPVLCDTWTSCPSSRKTGCRERPLHASHSDGYDLPSREASSRTCPAPMYREAQWSLSHIPVLRDTRTSCPSSREAGRRTGMYKCRGRQDAVSGRRKRPASGTLVQYSG